jgi:ring-1,2-phenylacetyl-CoA epoxidase subunit PaaE
MLEFHPLKVAAVERIAEDAACLTVEIPSALRDAFAFHAGQYVTVRRMIEGRE